MNRHKFHDVACQGNLKFCQGIVREMSGNFVSAGVWQPCLCFEQKEGKCHIFSSRNIHFHSCIRGGATRSVVERRTPERDVGGSKPSSCRVVSLSKTLYSPKVLVIPKKRWLRPDMKEKLLTGTLSRNTNKQNSCINHST